jgi:hypothetical protein
MDERGRIERLLAEAEYHVLLGERHIIRQREIVAELERDGHEQAAVSARDLLETFEQAQKAHVADRDRLRAELAALG